MRTRSSAHPRSSAHFRLAQMAAPRVSVRQSAWLVLTFVVFHPYFSTSLAAVFMITNSYVVNLLKFAYKEHIYKKKRDTFVLITNEIPYPKTLGNHLSIHGLCHGSTRLFVRCVSASTENRTGPLSLTKRYPCILVESLNVEQLGHLHQAVGCYL